MSSGITPTDECVSLFNDMKLKHDRKWIIFKIDDKQIVKEREGDKDATYESFMAALKEVAENEPRYAVVDYHYKTEDGRPQDKLLFIAWSPDTCGVKPKMTYASSKDALLKKLNGVHKAFRRTKPHLFLNVYIRSYSVRFGFRAKCSSSCFSSLGLSSSYRYKLKTTYQTHETHGTWCQNTAQ